MRKNFTKLFSIGLLCFSMYAFGQQKPVTGKVLDSDGYPVQDAYVYVEGTDIGVYTDENGSYTIEVKQGDTIGIEFIGFDTKTITVGPAANYNIKLDSGGAVELKAIVATALGIERDQKSLGYASQEVDGEILTKSRSNNALSALSGNVAGVQISTPSSNMGGSTRITMRGIKSVTGENRPLIVVDGVPLLNDNFNSKGAQSGGGGRDYGDTAFDINPDDIESMNVLKGGAASALYGSRGSNGVILITTKTGKKGRDHIEYNSGVSLESINIWPELQNKYGAGSSDKFEQQEINGVTYNLVDYALDESWGPKYDSNVKVLPWYAFDPEFSADYLKPVPWVAPKKDIKHFFRTGTTFTNSIAFSKSFDNSMMRVSASNMYTNGIVPNSKLVRNSITVGMKAKFSKRLEVSSDITYINTNAFNRPVVGYADNSVMQKFIQWGQRQLDVDNLKNYVTAGGKQRVWNRRAWNNSTPAYSDNPYWTVYKNTGEDERNRYYGNFKLKYNLADNLYVVGNVYGDGYVSTASSHVAVGSQAQSSFYTVNRMAREVNYESRIHFDKDFDWLSLNSFIGGNIRNDYRKSIDGYTVGGLIVADLYNLSNSMNDPRVRNSLFKKRVNSVFGLVSLGIKDVLFLEATGRNDWSSTLPEKNNSYFYPSASASFVISEIVKEKWLNFAKARVAWARTANDLGANQLTNVFETRGGFLSYPAFNISDSKANKDLVPEITDSWEVGLEMSAFRNRVSFDLTYYNSLSSDLLMPVQVSNSTGYNSKYFNAAKLSNKGVEALVTVVPVRTEDFQWSVNWNFAKNKNKVEDLYEDIEALNITNAPFSKVTLWAMKGEEYGQLRGTDFIYDDQGNKVVGANGRYLSTGVKNLGSIIPDYNMGFRNTLDYKNISLSFLIDFQKGGKFYSISNMWGHYSGMLAETAEGSIREDGVIADAVTGDVKWLKDSNGNAILDGQGNPTYEVNNTAPNKKAVDAEKFFGGYYSGPQAQNIFNADYVKLRDVTLSYTLPDKFKGVFKNVEFSVFGRNLLTWGLDNKNWDPEQASTGSGNIQGIEGGSLPSTRSYGMNVKLQF